MMDPKHLQEIRDMLYVEFADYSREGEDRKLLHDILLALEKYSDYLDKELQEVDQIVPSWVLLRGNSALF